MFACNGILFNHESPIRGETFVTRKITRAAARISLGLQEKIYLGNLDSKRDWGHAKDFVKGMWLILQQEKPEDFVLATGETHTVREFVELAFKETGIELEWSGKGIKEKGVDKKSRKTLVEVDPSYFRPTEVDLLLGDPTKAREKLGWSHKYSLNDLVKDMMENDIQEAKKDSLLKQEGFRLFDFNE
jgi:GDPmannose 4,6-dehydratase